MFTTLKKKKESSLILLVCIWQKEMFLEPISTRMLEKMILLSQEFHRASCLPYFPDSCVPVIAQATHSTPFSSMGRSAGLGRKPWEALRGPEQSCSVLWTASPNQSPHEAVATGHQPPAASTACSLPGPGESEPQTVSHFPDEQPEK